MRGPLRCESSALQVRHCGHRARPAVGPYGQPPNEHPRGQRHLKRAHAQEFTRQELYDLVWATPTVKLASQFGLSNVGLRKICVKRDISTPPLGYWAKLNFGKPVSKPALKPPSEGISDRVLVFCSVRGEETNETDICKPSILLPATKPWSFR